MEPVDVVPNNAVTDNAVTDNGIPLTDNVEQESKEPTVKPEPVQHCPQSKHNKKCKPGHCCMKRKEFKKTRDAVIAPRSPWSCFLMKHKLPKEKLQDQTKRLGPQWRAQTKEERKQYEDLALNDKLRFERDLSNMNLDQRDAYQRCKRNQQKRTRQEHPRMTNYNMFVKLELPQIQAENPEFGFDELGKELGKRWSNLTVEEKQDYKFKSKQYKLEKLKDNKKRHKHCK